MAFDALAEITKAENDAKAAVAAAQQQAKQLIADAENTGKAGITAAISKAETELAKLKTAADSKAVEQAESLSGDVNNKRATLRVKAEARIEKAADLIVERIVNG